MTPDMLADLHARTMRVPAPWSARDFSTLLLMPGVYLEGDATGIALGRTVADEAELLTLAVSPDVQRQGRGRRLLADFEATTRQRGAVILHLEVAADNAAARALYDSAGYEVSGRRPRYYRTPDGTRIDAILMRRTLAAG
ncbi:ribosomal-protein-alanine N-acetyltransferase [Tranquillimonas rosea]|uniref:Ribosomal-protein-alanine N-acetyltransferase n=1 Tax=Tranquillimonas rosea TaxID=641238 RepID=A0A1H9SBU0_9RHOB|nr:GNAT family N-acetyltransferase [Tranquillimonas rosea]SER82035.1 ribosomal-protein-alanine N-acetyltransferase [Tranquillimonas rosea]